MAAQIVQDLLDGKPAPAHPLIAPSRGIAARESTAMFVCADERVAAVVCRMECAERLLGETDLKMTAVAAESGVGDMKSLARFFHLKHRATLSGYRSSVREGQRQETPRSRG